MPRKHRPRYGWIVNDPDNVTPRYTDEQQNRIIQAINNERSGPLSEEGVADVLDYVYECAWEFEVDRHWRTGPRPTEVEAALTEIRDSAETLSKAIRQIDDFTLTALLRQRGAFYREFTHPQPDSFSRMETLEKSLGMVPALIGECDEAIDCLDDPNPPPAGNDPLSSIIIPHPFPERIARNLDDDGPLENAALIFFSTLARAFQVFTNVNPIWHRDDSKNAEAPDPDKDVYKGNFHDFAHACVHPLKEYAESTLNNYLVRGLAIFNGKEF